LVGWLVGLFFSRKGTTPAPPPPKIVSSSFYE